MNRLALPFLALVSFTSVLLSQSAAEPEEWSAKVYRYPAMELIGGFISSSHGQLTPPPLPAADAKEEDILAFLKRSNFVASQHLIAAGIILPAGSLVVFDPQNSTLALRSTRLTHERMAALAAQAERNMSRHVNFSVQIIEADGTIVREAVKSVSAQADHAAALALLEGLVGQGKAAHVGSLRLETKSGTRATVSRGEERLYIANTEVDEARRSSTTMETRHAGTYFEVEPTIGADGETMELTFALEHHHGPPVEHWDKVNASGDRVVEIPNIDFHNAKITTSITMLGGMTKLAGIWQPEGNKEAERASRLQAAFVQAHIVTLLPALSQRAELLLKQHGEKVEKTPTAPPPEIPGATKGIITRSFHITEDSMSGSAAAAAPDAFGSPAGGAAPAAAPMVNEARLTVQITAMDILKSKGIPFPEGSSANYTPSTGELLVRNTKENMKLVEEFLGSLKKYSPHTVAMTLHLVEAPAAALRKLERETLATTDHTAGWQMLEQEIAQGRARVLRTAFVETKSGTHSTFTTGREYIHPTSGDTLSTTSKPGGTAPADAKGAVTNIQVSNGGTPRFSPEVETRLVGLRFDMEPTVMHDETIELTYNVEYDYAEPTPNDSSGQGDGKSIRPLNRSIQFHRANLTTGTPFMSGTSRLLGIWKPEGTAELDKADVLQAAFLTLDAVPVVRQEKK